MIQWGHDLVATAEKRRDWSQLPQSFECDAVSFCFRQIKDHFRKEDPGERIRASKAKTFAELRAALKAPNLGILFGFSHHHAWSGAFTARIPDQCQTFEQANSPSNKSYCDQWFAAHERDKQ